MSAGRTLSQFYDRRTAMGERSRGEFPEGQAMQSNSHHSSRGGHVDRTEGGDGTMISDGDLMARVQTGDREAFEVIMQRGGERREHPSGMRRPLRNR